MAYRKRARYIINKKLQIGFFLKWIIVPVFFIAVVLYCFKDNFYVLSGAFACFLIYSWWIMVLSHRFAGPIYRLEKDLEDIAKGNFSMRIKFRKKDELKSIAEGINKMLDEIEKRIGK
jgi:signal transduction histidine kinase